VCPNDLAILNLIDRFRKHEFHDTTLSSKVKQARHAVALQPLRDLRFPGNLSIWVYFAILKAINESTR